MSTLVVSAIAAAQTVAIYLFLILVLRGFGRRQLAELSLVDYLIIALLGSAAEAGLYAGSSGLVPGLTSAATLLLTNRALVGLSSHSTTARRILLGGPLLLVYDGQLLTAQLRRCHLTQPEVLEALRMRGYGSLSEVRYVVLEIDGSIGVIPYP